MHIRFQKKLILKIALSLLFILISTSLILSLINEGKDKPGAIQRTVGFDSFADFFLSSIGGIITGLILAIGLIIILRWIFFSQKFRGPINVLQEQLHQLENGDFRIRPYMDSDENKDAIFSDLRALQEALEDRFLQIKCAAIHLEELRYKIGEMNTNASLGREYLEEKLETMKKITDDIQGALINMKFSTNENLSRILLIGGGGREHAICAGLAASRHTDTIYAVPGNPGIAEIAECPELPVKAPFTELTAFAREKGIGLVVIGPEQPLVEGIADAFRAQGIPVFGPDKKGARIEGSKSFAKELMTRYEVPTAGYEEFTDFEKAAAWINSNPGPYVLKADGLAAGKGVHITEDREDAVNMLREYMVNNRFGDSGNRVVIEEFMRGEEASILAFVDNETFLPLVAAQDHKAAYNGDTGPNTGGMGAYAPAPVITQTLSREIDKKIFRPMMDAFRQEGIDYRGVLYAGLMITEEGPKVVEFNCRFGDPETQAVLPLIKTDLAELLWATATNSLSKAKVEYHPGSAVSVVAASEGYPGEYPKGREISGLDNLPENTMVFHAGTAKDSAKKWVTSGGRVLAVTAVRPSLEEAIEAAYNGLDSIAFQGMHYRSDIGAKGLNRK